MNKKIATLMAVTIAASAQTFGGRVSPDLQQHDTASEVDVIVQYREGHAPVELTGVRAGRVRAHRFANLPFAAMRVSRGELARLAADPDVEYITPDREVSAAHFPPYMIREALGYRFAAMQTPERPAQKGTGVGIAILDSGVTADDYFKKWTSSGCTGTRIVHSKNFVTNPLDPVTTNDLYGHGTHVAGIAAGDARCLPGAWQDFSGMAPEASIINLRVLDSRGKGTDSTVIGAIDYAIQNRTAFKIRVMNLSLGRVIRESFTRDPLCQAVERAWKAGIVVVVAAGNMGRDNSMLTQGYGTITSPANDPYVLTVGATRMVGHTGWDDDTVSSYSSKGPALLDQVVKPDLVAPGNIVYARMAPSQYLVTSYTANTLTYLLPGGTSGEIPNVFLLSGTSMAAPVAAGAAALVYQKESTYPLTAPTPDQVKSRLMKTAHHDMNSGATIIDSETSARYEVRHDLFTVGAGHLNLRAALGTGERSPSTRRALSPRVDFVNGQVVFKTSYSDLGISNVVWSDTTNWGQNVVWSDSFFAVGTSNVNGTGVVWGYGDPQGTGVIWGDNVVWSDTNPFSESLSVKGDR